MVCVLFCLCFERKMAEKKSQSFQMVLEYPAEDMEIVKVSCVENEIQFLNTIAICPFSIENVSIPEAD